MDELVVYGSKEIQERYGVSKNIAYKIIRSVRMSYGGGKLGIPGKILYTELIAWEHDVKKEEVRRL